MKVLLSYPRSGNHLVRFFIELLAELPTNGCIGNQLDIPIYKNIFPESIPFNIDGKHKYNINNLFTKFHMPPDKIHTELILIVRNPREVLIRQKANKFEPNGWDGYNTYFRCIDYYNNFNGKKKIFFYEDILIDKVSFIKELYNFLNIRNPSKKAYVIENIDKLFELSKQGKKRAWGGVKSDSLDYYYKNINGEFKDKFDNYIKSMIATNKYNIIKNKYDL
jgi:hypothetical protein